MAYVGTRKGPRESEIVSRLGAAYFGITPAALENEIEWYLRGEVRDEITPVRRDKSGRYYIKFSAPNGGEQSFYLDEYGYTLEGDVRIWEADATSVEVKP